MISNPFCGPLKVMPCMTHFLWILQRKAGLSGCDLGSAGVDFKLKLSRSRYVTVKFGAESLRAPLLRATASRSSS